MTRVDDRPAGFERWSLEQVLFHLGYSLRTTVRPSGRKSHDILNQPGQVVRFKPGTIKGEYSHITHLGTTTADIVWNYLHDTGQWPQACRV